MDRSCLLDHLLNCSTPAGACRDVEQDYLMNMKHDFLFYPIFHSRVILVYNCMVGALKLIEKILVISLLLQLFLIIILLLITNYNYFLPHHFNPRKLICLIANNFKLVIVHTKYVLYRLCYAFLPLFNTKWGINLGKSMCVQIDTCLYVQTDHSYHGNFNQYCMTLNAMISIYCRVGNFRGINFRKSQ